ncbi:hypothetical protein SporoP37_16535 (plasmid) [Sporosarcina sp. P37]|uniref:MobA/MobL family protein n=1 Tax=unclassified Sporosarcina TaxID=2647733 RepID=UPI000A17DF6B|nr:MULTISPECIES: MobA/MobL family protein [unclassified Sporosarcina]ARK26386.1 hypothetical protein SporoP37_16535 [Sporosarcina sp. P37]PID17617.1 hypothetical protein CSV62_12500 [Sporosarcina sp. P35]
MPDWCVDRERLWNEVENIEKTKNAQLAREFTVVLPIELSNQQQKELLKHFVQEMFVDEGMVADIAIHRDDAKNPHAHVMLTMRSFLKDGSWGAKSKKEYILDEDGESLYTASGAKKSRKIDMNDWNKREKIQEWRQAWALYANQHLALAGVAVEITEKSHAELGLEQEPMIHEGYVARKMEQEGRSSDRVEINRQVKARNEKVVSLREVDEKLTNLENHQMILQALSPMEKKELGELSKVLKMYVKPESLADKRRMLYLWDVKLQVQVDLGLFNESSYKGYQAQEEAFQRAEEVFNREADRLTVKYYPTLETSQWTSYEKRALINETARLDRTLNELEIKETLLQAREEEVVEQIQSILKQPITTVIEAQERLQAVQTRAAIFMQQQGVSLQQKASMDRLSPAEKENFENMLKEIKRLQLALRLFGSYYDERIHLRMPSLDLSDKSLVEREWLMTAMDYYGEAFTKERLTNFPSEPPKKYKKEQLVVVPDYVRVKRAYDVAVLRGEQVSAQELLRVQKGMDLELLKDLAHPRYQTFVLSDCVAEDILSGKNASAFLAAVEVATDQGPVFYNDTFGGKQMNVYSSQTLFEQFFKGKAIDRILDELNYEEFEKLKAQQKQMKQQKKMYQRRRS